MTINNPNPANQTVSVAQNGNVWMLAALYVAPTQDASSVVTNLNNYGFGLWEFSYGGIVVGTVNITQYNAVAGGCAIDLTYTVSPQDFPIGNLNIINTYTESGTNVHGMQTDNPLDRTQPFYDTANILPQHINGNSIQFDDSPRIAAGPPYAAVGLHFETFFVQDQGVVNGIHNVVIYEGIVWGVTVQNNNLPGEVEQPGIQPKAVPEPTSLILLSAGILFFVGYPCRRHLYRPHE